MRKSANIIILGVILISGFKSFSQPHSLAVRIAAASDLKFALDSIISIYNETHSVPVMATYGSSGKLSEQIRNGAPFDIFFSADVSYPMKLKENGLTASDIHIYALGRIVIWSKVVDPVASGFACLLDEKVRKIAIANPRHAPYGRIAVDALKHYNLHEQLEHRLVYGENVSQAAQFVYSGAAQVGIIALSIALSPAMQKENGKYYIIPESIHKPLEQGYVILKTGREKKAVKEFIEFVETPQSKSILNAYGLRPPETPSLK